MVQPLTTATEIRRSGYQRRSTQKTRLNKKPEGRARVNQVDLTHYSYAGILLGTTTFRRRRENGETGKLRLRLHGENTVRRRASPARPTPRQGHPSNGSPKRESSRNGQASRSNRNNLGLLENYSITRLDYERTLGAVRRAAWRVLMLSYALRML